ncbi:MAG: hypothetical protein AB8B61_06930 [Cyclobacteriaceae bacterium]
MKKRVLIITLALFSVATSSKSQQLDVGSGFFYIPGEDGLNLAVEGKVSYQFNDNWRASFSGDIFFSKSGIPQDASVVVNFPLTVATNAKGNFLNLEAIYTSQQLYCSPFVL